MHEHVRDGITTCGENILYKLLRLAVSKRVCNYAYGKNYNKSDKCCCFFN